MKFIRCFIPALLIATLLLGSLNGVSVRADGGRPNRVSCLDSSMQVQQGHKFEIKASVSPHHADDDYVRWEIISGKKCVSFEDNDHSGDDIDMIAEKPGTAKVRCYISGRNKKTSGDTITIHVKKSTGDYSLRRDGSAEKYEEVHDDFDLEVKAEHSIKNSELVWDIKNTDIVTYNHDQKGGREIEFYAKKTGTTKITCTCTNKNATPKSITYTIHVVYDD